MERKLILMFSVILVFAMITAPASAKQDDDEMPSSGPILDLWDALSIEIVERQANDTEQQNLILANRVDIDTNAGNIVTLTENDTQQQSLINDLQSQITSINLADLWNALSAETTERQDNDTELQINDTEQQIQINDLQDQIDTIELTEGEIPAAIGFTGGDQPHENRPPYVGIKYIICTGGAFPVLGDPLDPAEPAPLIGEIRMFAGPLPPTGWVYCDGEELEVNEYPGLFGVIGTTFGGDHVNTFAVPDLRGRVPVHAGAGPGLTPVTMGEQGGQESVILTVAQMPNHNHTIIPEEQP